MGTQVVKMLAKEIKGSGKAGIMVTHDLRMVDYRPDPGDPGRPSQNPTRA